MAKSARTQRQLADLLGITQQAVSKLSKRRDWPVRRRGPWSTEDVTKLTQWRATLQEDRSQLAFASDDELGTLYKQSQLLLKTEQAKRARLEREVLTGEKIRREALDSALGGMAAAFVAICNEIEMTFPARFGVPADRISDMLDEYRRGLVDRGEVALRPFDDVAREVADQVSR